MLLSALAGAPRSHQHSLSSHSNVYKSLAVSVPGHHRRPRPVAPRAVDDDHVEPDWDAEMTLFKKRITKPNQLSTLRRMLERADRGTVLYSADSLAIVQGLVNDAPVGTELVFANGTKGYVCAYHSDLACTPPRTSPSVLLWRRSDNVCFALVLDAHTNPVKAGDGVECVVKGILQVVDETEGPTTQREFSTFTVATGPSTVGTVVDHLCRPSTLFTAEASRRLGHGDSAAPAPPSAHREGHAAIAAITAGADAPDALSLDVPLFNVQLDMKSRQQITEPLITQIMAQLLTGSPGCLQHEAALDAILGQADSDVRCVYAAVGKSVEETRRAVELLSQHGALAYTTVVVASEEAPLGEQYAALAAACSLGEQVRDSGGHALVVLDDVSATTRLWEGITVALADLGPKAMELQEGDSVQVEQGGEEALVEYEGMLVSAAAAQRRRFFSSLIQRAAKVDARLGGGSLTLLMVLLGTPATGQKRSAAAAQVQQYKHLTEAQKAKLQAALEAQQGPSEGPVEGAVRTEVVEEWMSITDGQVVMTHSSPDDTEEGTHIDPQLSVSRVGARAHFPATAQLAPAVRLELAQAADAQRFGDAGDDVARRTLDRAARTAAALKYVPRQATPYEEQVVMLYALQRGFLEAVAPQEANGALDRLLTTLRQTAPGMLERIAASRELSEEDEAELEGTLDVLSTLLKTKGIAESALLQVEQWR